MGIFSKAGESLRKAADKVVRTIRKPPRITPPKIDVGKALRDASAAVDGALDTAEDAVVRAGSKVVEAAKPVGEKIGDAAGDLGGKVADATRPARDRIGDVARDVGDRIGDAAEDVRDTLEPVGDRIGDAANDAGRKVGEAATHVGGTLKPVGDRIGEAAQDAGERLRPVGEKIGEVAADVGERLEPVADKLRPLGEKIGGVAGDVGEKLQPAADKIAGAAKVAGKAATRAIEEAEHFLRTGDWGHAVEKLQEAEAEAKADLAQATADHNAALRALIASDAKLRTLSVLYERNRRDTDALSVDAVEVDVVDADLYGHRGTDFLDRIGLDAIGDGWRVFNEYVVMDPISIVLKQHELTETRDQLRKNIATLDAARHTLEKATAGFDRTTTEQAAEIARLEAQIAAAGLEESVSAASAMQALKVEQATKTRLARDLLAKGMPPETVAEMLGLAPQAVIGLAAEPAAT